MTYNSQSSRPPAADETRGTIFALAIVPLGVIAWCILWNFGFIASIVGFGVALGAVFLYRMGSGGQVTRGGAIRVSVLTILTLALAFFAGIVLDALQGYSAASGETQMALVTNPLFWSDFFAVLGEPDVLGSYLPDFGLALLFGVLGCFSVLRTAFREAAAPAAVDAADPAGPAAVDPAVDPQAPRA